jgi:hypothetical protein
MPICRWYDPILKVFKYYIKTVLTWQTLLVKWKHTESTYTNL